MYAYAATEAQTVAQELLSKINEAILFPLITLMMAGALLIFLYGAFEYVRGANNEQSRETGKRHLLYGTIGMLVMLSALSILYIAAGTFKLDAELDNARDTGTLNNGFFNFGKNSYTYDLDRAPLKNDFDDSKNISKSDTENIEENEVRPGSDYELATNPDNPFNRNQPMSEMLLKFHQTSPNATDQIKRVTSGDIVANFYEVNGQYPDDYLRYEDTVLMPWCESKGGTDVFSIDANNSMGRIFFCVY